MIDSFLISYHYHHYHHQSNFQEEIKHMAELNSFLHFLIQFVEMELDCDEVIIKLTLPMILNTNTNKNNHFVVIVIVVKYLDIPDKMDIIHFLVIKIEREYYQLV